MKKRAISLLLILTILICSVPLAFAANTVTATDAADELYSLGLFKGTDNGYELDRTMTRQEAIVMLVRLLGKESSALGGGWGHGFSDVSLWADGYIGYAYSKDLTTGYSATVFGSADDTTAAQYITFVLRALGYSESAGDFSWRAPWELSDKIGLTAGEYGSSADFTRADAVLISYNALSMRIKGLDMTLLEYLEAGGAISSSGTGSTGSTGLTAGEISQKCSPSVFYIEVYSDLNHSYLFATGSGFFITGDGVAVTNYHVVEGARSARITTTGGDRYDVTHMLYASKSEDLAIIRVSTTSTQGESAGSFPSLELGSSAKVQNGDVIYTIGSPLGLQNTISNGIVSNSSRVYDGTEYIQITAAISSGSSGGALLDDAGSVIGVTSATFENSQNMNLAVPIDLVKAVDISATGTEFSEYFAGKTSGADKTGYTLTASKSSVTLAAGKSETIIISHDYGRAASLQIENSNGSVVTTSWNGWQDQGSAELKLSGLAPGTATITVTFSDGTGSKDARAEIKVTVTA